MIQAMSSLREALQDSGQQKELDAVVGQLQELHQRQLQQLNAQHLVSIASKLLSSLLQLAAGVSFFSRGLAVFGLF